MKFKSFSVYDENDFFEKYNQKRKLGNSPNETVEKPIIDEILGDVKGLNILDLGCGDGNFGNELLDNGAAFYHGVEGSKNMFDLAKQNVVNDKSLLENKDIRLIEYKEGSYDLVVSRLVLHYIEDWTSVLHQVYHSLTEDGQFVFSIEHPVVTSCYEAYHVNQKRGSWLVDNYFESGERINIWNGKQVVKYHKTLEEYWALLQAAKFEVVALRESKPQASNFEDKHEFDRRNRMPLFLFFKLKKSKQ